MYHDACGIFQATGHFLLGLECFACAEDTAPRLFRSDPDTYDPRVRQVGFVTISFTEADFADGKDKSCSDGVFRRLLRAKIRIICGHYTRTLRVLVKSFDERRELGSVTFRFDEEPVPDSPIF